MTRAMRVLAAAAALALAAPGALAQQVTIGSGHVASIYHRYGEILCGLAQNGGGQACENVETLNFPENIDGLTQGKFTFGIMSSEWLDQAYQGVGRREVEGPLPKLRAVLALPSTVVTVLARPGANIREPLDLKGRRVRTAPISRIMPFRLWLGETDWQEEDFRTFGPMGFENSLIQLCADEADAVVFVDGHPGRMTNIATDKCELDLVAMNDEGAARVVEKDPTLMATEIPGGLYPRHPEATRTFGTYVVLVANEDAPEEAVYAMVKSVFADFDTLRAGHDALSGWQPEYMKSLNFPAPLHPGAERFYREAGLR